MQKGFVSWYHHEEGAVKSVENIEKIILDEGGILIKNHDEDSFLTGWFEHKFFNLENRGTVYLRTEGDWKEFTGRRFSQIYIEVYDSKNKLFRKVKEEMKNVKSKVTYNWHNNFKEEFSE